MATALMGMDLPVVSTTVGPTWASMINTALGVVDTHNHTSGMGAQVPSAGININADLSFGSYNASSLRSTRFTSQVSALGTASDVGCLYVVNGNLYYNNNSGTQIQITSGSGLNAASIGGIGGDYATSSASVSYTNATKIFSFTQSSGVSAKIACGDLLITETVSSANTVTLKSPTSLASSYSITLPTGAPASTKIVTMAATGALAATYDLDNSTIEVSGSSIRVKSSGITATQLAADAVTTVKILDSNVTFPKINPRSVTTSSTGTAGQIIQISITTNSWSNGSFYNKTENPWTPSGNAFSATLTTRGGPVRCEILQSGSSTNFEIANGAGLRLSMYYDGTMFYQKRLRNDSTGGNISFDGNCSGTTPALSAGSHTFTVGIDTDGLRDGGAYTFIVYEVI